MVHMHQRCSITGLLRRDTTIREGLPSFASGTSDKAMSNMDGKWVGRLSQQPEMLEFETVSGPTERHVAGTITSHHGHRGR
jgi:hypothetical protein